MGDPIHAKELFCDLDQKKVGKRNINQPMFKMVYTTHKNGDDLGMVYCFTVYSNHRSESRQVETILVWFDML
jgi:hypothetical protein